MNEIKPFLELGFAFLVAWYLLTRMNAALERLTSEVAQMRAAIEAMRNDLIHSIERLAERRHRNPLS